MKDPNKLILVGGIIIISTGFVYAANSGRPETPVLAGGVGFLLLASLLDALGGGWSKLAVGLVGLATVSVLLVEGPAIFQAISNTRNHTATVTANDTGSGSIQVPTTPTHSGGSQVM